jgi:glycopeptide antibiotics resistance protein
MPQKALHPPETPAGRKWSNRLLAASLFGILFFTLFPYWIDFSQKHSSGRSLFLLSRPIGFDGFLHTSLNTLLFVPFGFALSQFFVGRRRTFLKSLSFAVIAGAALSYSIEILQLYMPSRDSAWDDVLANTLGSLVGMFFGSVSGEFILRKLSEWERSAEQFLSLRTVTIAVLIYFGLWFVASIPLQRKTHLNNWDPNPYLFVGYDMRENTRWSGAVSRVQLWEHAVPAEQAIELTASSRSDDNISAPSNLSPLASYDLSMPGPVASSTGLLPSLSLRPVTTLPVKAYQLKGDEALPVLMSETPVSALSSRARQTNQIAVLVDCIPSRGNDRNGSILGIETLSGESDLVLRQDGAAITIYLRTGLESRKSYLGWSVPGLFIANVRRSILYSYDGAQASLYVDGRKIRKSFYLSPGTALVGNFIRNKTDELVAYSALYDSLVFLPIGFLLGLAVRIIPRHNPLYRIGICAGILLPAILLEGLLVWVSGGNASILRLFISIGFVTAGMIWINLDSPRTA